MAQAKHLIIFDGDCGFCQASVKRLLRRDHQGLFDSTPRQAIADPDLKARGAGEVVVVTQEGQTLGGARAILFIKSLTGWGAFARFLMLPPMIWVLVLGYRVIAKNRRTISRMFYPNQVCELPARPSPAEKGTLPKA